MGVDEATARAVFERFCDPLRGFFERRGASPEDSRDLTQETLLRVYRGMEGFRGAASLRTWVYVVARNVWRNASSRASLRQAAAPMVPLPVTRADDGSEEAADPADERITPEQEACGRELEAAVRVVLGRLAPGMRRCLELWLQDFTYVEIAKVLQISVGTVKSHLSSAKKRLGEELLSFLGEGESP